MNMFGHIIKPKIQTLGPEEFMLHKSHNKITGRNGLHHYGELHRLMISPYEYAPTVFGLASIVTKPVSVASLTRSTTDSYVLLSQSINKVEINFPNIEIMAFTDPEYRKRGISTSVIKKLLEQSKVPCDYNIYCYSDRMERMLKRLGYVKARNLHEYTP